MKESVRSRNAEAGRRRKSPSTRQSIFGGGDPTETHVNDTKRDENVEEEEEEEDEKDDVEAEADAERVTSSSSTVIG